jgi:hypothetical protein
LGFGVSRQKGSHIIHQLADPYTRVLVPDQAGFTKVFNRTQIGNPATTAPATTPSKNGLGQYTGGFGVINLTVAGPNIAPTYTQNAVVGQLYQLPRSGTLIARFTF